MNNGKNTITYAESEGAQPFDWNAFLDKAIKDDITNEEYENAKKLANSWITCACGNQCAALPRRITSGPEDTVLYNLGIDFSNLIDERHFKQAMYVLQSIEERSAYLLSQMRNV